MRSRRLRLTIRGLMVAVAVVAVYCAQWVYLQNWESRRAVMYQQRDLTRSSMLEARPLLAEAGRPASEFRNESDPATYTSRWTEKLEAWEVRDGQRRPLIRASVSGATGRFSLPSIVVKTYASPMDGLWLERLLQAYRRKGWRYTVIRAPGG